MNGYSSQNDDFSLYRRLFEHICPPPVPFSKGTSIYRQGETNQWMYYLLEGTVKAHITNASGRETIIGHIKNDRPIGLHNLTGVRPSTFSYVALTDVQLLPFNRDFLNTIIAEEPGVLETILAQYNRTLLLLVLILENLSHDDVKTKVVSCMYRLAVTDYSGTKKHRLSQQEMAAHINVSRTQVTRVFTQLKAEGVISTSSKGYVIEDYEKLAMLNKVLNGHSKKPKNDVPKEKGDDHEKRI